MDVYKIPRKPVATSSHSISSLGPLSGRELSSHTATGTPSTSTDGQFIPTKINTYTAIDHAYSSDRNTCAAGSSPKDHLVMENGDHPEYVGQEIYVKWGIAWKTPLLIVLWAVIGLGWALGHHFYYQSLDGTKPGSSSRQGWAVRFGTAFSFLVITCLRASCDMVYKQYIWTLFKRKSFSLRTVDRLFAATQDPLSLLSLEFLRHAKVAYLVALICWCMALAGIAPPATLSVVPGFSNHTEKVSWPSLDWNSTKFFAMESPSSPFRPSYHTSILPIAEHAAQPSSELLRIAMLAAESMAVIPPTPPAVNSTFHVQFFGPSMQCTRANSSQERYFDAYASAMAKNTSVMKVTRSLFESGELNWGGEGYSPPGGIAPLMNIYSAFSPWSGYGNWLGTLNDGIDYSVDAFNNWIPDIPVSPDDLLYRSSNTTQQVWIQTADQGIVCTLGNASFEVWFEFVDAVQTRADYSITNFTAFLTPPSGSTPAQSFGYDAASVTPLNSYMAMYLAFSSLVNGNVSTTLTDSQSNSCCSDRVFDGNVTMYEGSSKILQHGLSACEEIVHSYWNGNNAIGIGKNGPVRWPQATTRLHVSSGGNSTSNADGPMRGYVVDESANFSQISNNLFTKPAWMCRNQTLLRAIEDLANNLTISMLSSTLAKQNATTIDAFMFPTINLYSYNSRNLLLSYGIAVLVTLFCAAVGAFALRYNGVAHSTAFSAIVSTTRNGELDGMARGHSLGEVSSHLKEMRLRYGEITTAGEKERYGEGGRGEGRHIGFGAAENIVGLKKGAKYV